MIHIRNLPILFFWLLLNYFIFLLQPSADFEEYIKSLTPDLNHLHSELTLLEKSESYALYNLSIDLDPKPLHAYIRIPNKSKNFPIVIILGGMMTGKSAVNYAYGVTNVVLAAPDYRYNPRNDYNILTIFYDMIEAYEALYMQIVDNLLIINYLKSWTNNEKQNLSILGYSFGVPFALATAAVNNDIDHLALIYGGADLKFLLHNNLNLYNNFLDDILVNIIWLHVITFEPEQMASQIKSEPVLLINGLKDEKIPEIAAKKLHDAIKVSKTALWVDSKHVHPRNKKLTLKIIEMLNNWYIKTEFF